MQHLLALPLLASLGLGGAPTPKIEWEADWEAALERAGEEGRLVMLAVAMDDEGRSERFLKEIYPDRDVQELAGEAVCLIACGDMHREGKACPRYDGVDCRGHYDLEMELREGLLAGDANGAFALPQHIWFGPDGRLLLSASYELTADEMRWCFWQAEALLRPEEVGEIPEGARPPRRMLFGQVFAPPAVLVNGRGLRSDELEDAIKELKGSMFGSNRIPLMQRVLFADAPEAVECIRMELGSALVTIGGTDMLERAIHVLGTWSPEAFWEIVAEYVKHSEELVRSEVAIAFEQLGNPAALKVVKTALSKEQDVRCEKNWLRALGACGWNDKAARKTLLAVAQKDRNDLLRRNALIALGYLEPDEKVRECLLECLGSGPEKERLAAACAMGISRRPEWLGPLREAIEACEDKKLRVDLEAVAGVLEGADLAAIEDQVMRAGSDHLLRERLFFKNGRPEGRAAEEDGDSGD